MIVGMILSVIGILLIVAFLMSRLRCRTLTRAAVSKISEQKRYYKGRVITDYIPVFEYSVNGKKYTYKADSSTRDPNRFYIGQELNLYIDAKHPETARYGSNAGYCIAGILFAAVGIFFLVLAFI